ncbi:homocysteine S-methyltransferase family protein [Phaeobacter sp. NW0010-22]|uniref:homocysteine S-methyltransferase family protein n=1 Tax=Phaeobacter sp. NW0010-22 TaxID=3135907 RepID=UPI0031097686
MAAKNNSVLDPNVDLYLAYVGMETDLIFNRGIDLPGFASYPLLETQEGRTLLKGYLSDMVALGRAKGKGVILESPTWVANRDRGAAIGYNPETLQDLNQKAIELMVEMRSGDTDIPILISANLGPRDDAYTPTDQMTADEAETYHTEQISVLAQTDADVISGYTLAYPAEAIGIIRATRRFGLPVVIAFTVETDGKLPTGLSLEEAITEVDEATDGYAAYFMINCAHPEHFDKTLVDGAWMQRIKGIVANASRCSHAELDEATELDAGNPHELGHALNNIRKRLPHIKVLGGCCGTDMRHMTEIADSAFIPSL